MTDVNVLELWLMVNTCYICVCDLEIGILFSRTLNAISIHYSIAKSNEYTFVVVKHPHPACCHHNTRLINYLIIICFSY